jgi:N4-gp56 family major capsid protein
MNKLWMLFSSIFFCQYAWTTEMSVTGVAEVDAAIPQYWADSILMDGNRESFWGSLSGKEGSGMPIIDKTGKLKEKGDTMTINTIAQLFGSGVTGQSVLKGNEEDIVIGTINVTCDVVRHAVAVGRKATKQANFDVIQTVKAALTSWMTRRMDTDAFNTILANTQEVIYANSKTSLAALNETDGDFFGPYELSLIRSALIRKGAMPITMKKNNGRTVPIYGVVFSEIDEQRLMQNSGFRQELRDALERFKGSNNHPLFEGAIGVSNNMILYSYYSNLSMPQGTPLRPECQIQVTLTTAATTLVVGATPTTGVTPNFTEFFASSGSLQIEDEIISYTAKTNNSFTTLTRGASSTTNIQHSQYVLVTQRNVSSVIGFGAEALCRAIGDSPEPIGEKDDYGEQVGLGVRAYYGQTLKTDARLGRATNIVILKCLSKNPGTI